LLRGIESVDFKDVPSDIVGRIFQKLIGPEERHRYGQHFTGDDVVDLINAFCIRDGGTRVLDPACGCGTLLFKAHGRECGNDRAATLAARVGAPRVRDLVRGLKRVARRYA
jgi:hypothetical protein